MAWVKIPKEHHAVFLEALPAAPDVSTVRMFGGIGAMVKGHLAAALFGRSMMVRLDEADRVKAMALEGAAIFDPMGNGRSMKDSVLLPEDVMEDVRDLRAWIVRGVAYTRTLPLKVKKKPAAKKAAPKKAAPKKAAPKKAAQKNRGDQQPTERYRR
jgi:TfoX/Sxy family transcriptional regulator of competence genes